MTSLALNPAQRAAVEHHAAPLLVLAGAGSGKTRVLTARLAHLVAGLGVRPDRIFATTFTNRAAREMRHRVAALLGREPDGLWIGTFHSLCARLLRREAARLGFTPRYTIYDEDDRLALLKRLLEQAGHSPKTFPPRVVQAIISGAKNRLVSAADLEAAATERLERVAAELYARLQEALRQANAMDFDDLLVHPLTLFREHPDRLEAWQRRFEAILVDEFQDTNRAQYLLVRSLAQRHGNICVVGDDDQSIYSWRGAEIRNMLDFQQDFPAATVVRLEENYRSTQTILDAANALIAENSQRLGKTLFTNRRGGARVTIVACADERDEAEWIVRELRARCEDEHHAHADLAVLYRTNAQSRALEEACRRAGVAYRVVGAVSFYERREVKDLVAYLRLIVNPADDEAFLRAVQVPKRGLGLSSLASLQAAAGQWGKPLLAAAAVADRVPDLRPQARQAFRDFAALIERVRVEAGAQSPAAVLERVIEAVAYEAHLEAEGVEGVERIENVRELLAAAAEGSEEVTLDEDGTPLERFLATAALTTSAEQAGGDPDGVTLMTVHTAKGLEWPVVVVAGLEDGLFPLSRALETIEGAEEERRLAYVAVTRARDRLYLTWARTRRRGGQLMPGLRSRFVEAIPPGVAEERRTSSVFDAAGGRRSSVWEPAAPLWPGVRREPLAGAVEDESQDAPRYVKGERVRHHRFGTGTIRGLQGRGRDLKVEVDFDDAAHGRKLLVVAYAGLEREWESA